MELDDLKNDWEQTSNKIDKQHNLTPLTISEMTRKKYRHTISKIKIPELAGSLICLLGVAFITYNFGSLNTASLQITGVLATILLIVLPILSYVSLWQFGSSKEMNKPHAEVLRQFARNKLRFGKYQKLNGLLSYLLLVTTIILLPKFFFDKDITFIKSFWVFAFFSIGYIFLLFFSKWVRKYYGASLQQAEELLRETSQ